VPSFFHNSTNGLPYLGDRLKLVKQNPTLKECLALKHKQFVKNIALSALMVSAIAVPAAANAESGTKPANIQTASQEAPPPTITLKAIPSVAAVQLADPLKLAKEYAPDTVTDWEQTLEKYNALAGRGFTVATLEEGTVSLVPAGDAPIEFKKSILTSAETVQTLPEQGVDGNRNIRFSQTAKPAEPIAGGSGNVTLPKSDSAGQISAVIAVSQDDPNGNASLQTVSDGKIVTLQASPAGDSFIEGQIALHEAVQSKDAEAIKKSLAELLKLYKAQIEKLEQAAE
jgi:hypothetical protein